MEISTQLLVIDRLGRPKISKDRSDLNNITNQLGQTDVNRILHWTTIEYTFFSSTDGRVTKIDDILGHHIHLNVFKRIESMQSMVSDYHRIKLEIGNKRIAAKGPNIWILNNTLLNDL